MDTKEYVKISEKIISCLVLVTYIVIVFLKYEHSGLIYNHYNFIDGITNTIIAVLLLRYFIPFKKAKYIRYYRYIMTCFVAIDFAINDSLVALVFLSVLFIAFINGRKSLEEGLRLSRLFLVFIAVVKANELLFKIGVIRNDTIMLKNSGIFTSIILVMAIIIEYLYFINKSENTSLLVRKIIVMASILAGVIILILMSTAIFTDYNSLIKVNQIKSGDYFYIIDKDGGTAYTYNGNSLYMSKINNSVDQRFKIYESEEEGMWHIYTQEGQVFDICNTIYKDGNPVIIWDENGTDGQHWRILSNDKYDIMIQSKEKSLYLSYDSTNKNAILSDDLDKNCHFILKDADINRYRFVGWMINKYNKEYLIYTIFLLLGVLIFGVAKMAKRIVRN